MDKFREQLKNKFPLLDVTHRVTPDNFKAAGYTGIKWPNNANGGTNIMKFIEATTWCNDNMPNSYQYVATVFWFVNKEDAMQFALKWL